MQPLTRILLALDITIIAALLLLCLWGVVDSRASIFNAKFWLVMLAVPGALTLAGVTAHTRGHPTLAVTLLLLPPVLPLAAAILVIAFLSTHPNWR